MSCKYLSDEFQEICTNIDCPYCTDFCPVTQDDSICKYRGDSEGNDKQRATKKS